MHVHQAPAASEPKSTGVPHVPWRFSLHGTHTCMCVLKHGLHPWSLMFWQVPKLVLPPGQAPRAAEAGKDRAYGLFSTCAVNTVTLILWLFEVKSFHIYMRPLPWQHLLSHPRHEHMRWCGYNHCSLISNPSLQLPGWQHGRAAASCLGLWNFCRM